MRTPTSPVTPADALPPAPRARRASTRRRLPLPRSRSVPPLPRERPASLPARRQTGECSDWHGRRRRVPSPTRSSTRTPTTPALAFTVGALEVEGTWLYRAQASDGTLTSAFSSDSAAVKVDRTAPL